MRAGGCSASCSSSTVIRGPRTATATRAAASSSCTGPGVPCRRCSTARGTRRRSTGGWAATGAGGPPHDRPPALSPPCYFNTGCCSFGDGDITGIEIAGGEIRLIRWLDDNEDPHPKILARDSLTEVLTA